MELWLQFVERCYVKWGPGPCFKNNLMTNPQHISILRDRRWDNDLSLDSYQKQGPDLCRHVGRKMTRSKKTNLERSRQRERRRPCHRSSYWWSLWLAGRAACSVSRPAASVWASGRLSGASRHHPPTSAWRLSSARWGSISDPESASVAGQQCPTNLSPGKKGKKRQHILVVLSHFSHFSHSNDV